MIGAKSQNPTNWICYVFGWTTSHTATCTTTWHVLTLRSYIDLCHTINLLWICCEAYWLSILPNVDLPYPACRLRSRSTTNPSKLSLCHSLTQSVRHDVLGAKLAQLKLHPSVLQWIISFLNGRTQQVKHASSFSSFKPINMGSRFRSGPHFVHCYG